MQIKNAIFLEKSVIGNVVFIFENTTPMFI
ncbi:hypothetical protein PBAL39_07040 [Pedobacter sp. BAL39]|nr:hypothetical protein PBAL39_07040 [Pedobacter sp. BAL39]